MVVQYPIRFSHVAGKDLQCDYLGKVSVNILAVQSSALNDGKRPKGA